MKDNGNNIWLNIANPAFASTSFHGDAEDLPCRKIQYIGDGKVLLEEEIDRSGFPKRVKCQYCGSLVIRIKKCTQCGGEPE